MTIEEILALEDKNKAIDMLCRDTKENRGREEYRKEYDGERNRRPSSVGFREDKMADIYSETETEPDGTPKAIGEKLIKAARISTNTPKRIVRTSTAFLFGGDMQVSFSEDNEASEWFKRLVRDKLKLKSVLNQFARTVKIETKAAILFIPVKKTNAEGKNEVDIRLKVLSLKNGDFYPHFDEFEDMDAFVRTYKAIHTDGKEREFAWIQTASKEITYINSEGEWKEIHSTANLAGKITVVYAEQELPDWEDVAISLDALENRLSRLVETNDYFSEPILKSYGETSLPNKSTVGKHITFPMEVDPETNKLVHGDADYLVWQQSVDSVKLEVEMLKDEIFSGTSTPNLSFENMRGIGALSGTAIKMMFMDAYIKAAEDMEIFAPVVTRCVNVLIAMIGNISNIKLKEQLEKASPQIKFGSILPEDLVELVETLTKAGGERAINAQKTLMENSPFTRNSLDEWKQMLEEEKAAREQNALLGFSL